MLCHTFTPALLPLGAGVDYASIVAFFASAAKGMSGMSPKEFIRVLRKEAKLTKEVMTDNELSPYFKQ